jgi:hypothetical protein
MVIYISRKKKIENVRKKTRRGVREKKRTRDERILENFGLKKRNGGQKSR